jgi:H+/Cl- antiporter ClcA
LETFARYTILAGIILILVGGLLYAASKLNLPFGRLPGDIIYQGQNATWYIPCATSIILSVLLTVILNLILRYLNK